MGKAAVVLAGAAGHWSCPTTGDRQELSAGAGRDSSDAACASDGYDKLPDGVKMALLDMAYNLGRRGC